MAEEWAKNLSGVSFIGALISFTGFPGVSAGKESACNAGDLGSVPGLGRSRRRERLPTPEFWPGEFHGLCVRGVTESDSTV